MKTKDLYDIAKEDKLGILDAQVAEARKVIFRSNLDLLIANNMIKTAESFSRDKRVAYEQTANSRITEADGFITQMKLAIDSCEEMKKSL